MISRLKMASMNTQKNQGMKKSKGEEVISEKQLTAPDVLLNAKRSAENSPEGGTKKRSVFGDITNCISDNKISNIKKNAQIKKHIKVVKTDVHHGSKIIKGDTNNLVLDKSDHEPMDSQEQGTEDVTLYISADEERLNICEASVEENNSEKIFEKYSTPESSVLPSGIEDFDKENINDPYAEPHYAAFVFEYYKEREKKFVVDKYMDRQPELTKGMRAILIDWMVEVQESFELNHETLYLAVKLVDHYLMRNPVPKATLQLVGATATLIACKYDERCPPLVDDFLYICDDSYSRRELITMEIKILKTVDFDLGIPLSYRYLRRYARCSASTMETLTLARYILEISLMDYELIDVPDSKLAAAALLLALKMKDLGGWTPTLQYYSGYRNEDLNDLMHCLNAHISSAPHKHLQTVKTKYSHKVFFEVAKIPPLAVNVDS